MPRKREILSGVESRSMDMYKEYSHFCIEMMQTLEMLHINVNNLEKIICSSDIHSKDVLAICLLA